MDRMNERTGNGGFSLLELLIVVAIILIIATLALPSFLRSRMSANESAAVSNLRQVNVAQNIYLIAHQSFGPLDQLVDKGLLDDRYDSGNMSGYALGVAISPDGLNYVVTAAAVSETTGRYDYYTTPDYVVRYSTTADRAPDGEAGAPVQ